jgi:hypothetical protein
MLLVLTKTFALVKSHSEDRQEFENLLATVTHLAFPVSAPQLEK